MLIAHGDDAFGDLMARIVAADDCEPLLVGSLAALADRLEQGGIAAMVIDVAIAGEQCLDIIADLRARSPKMAVPILLVGRDWRTGETRPGAAEVVEWIEPPFDEERLARALRSALGRAGTARPVIVHLDDDPDVLAITAAALEPEAQVVPARTLDDAMDAVRTMHPDAAIVDIHLADGSGLDLLPALVDDQGRTIPAIIYSAHDVPVEASRNAAAVLVKARGALPDLGALVRHIIADRRPPS